MKFLGTLLSWTTHTVIITLIAFGILSGIWGFTSAMWSIFTLGDGTITEQAQSLVDTGVRASATVLSIRETGSWFNNRPEVHVELEVKPAGQPSYTAVSTFYIALVAIPRVQPGLTIEVLVDAADSARVIPADQSLIFSL